MLIRIGTKECRIAYGEPLRRFSLKRRDETMSLVTAFCLENKDTLFVADKSSVALDEAGNSGGRKDDATKLREYSNGVIGYAGYAELAIDIIRALTPLVSSDPAIELQGKLLEQHHRLTARMPDHIREARAVEFIFANGTDCFYVFRSANGFSPEMVDWWGCIGLTGLATFAYYIFYNSDIRLNVEHAKRLGALQVSVTADASPTSVSHAMDMWLLRHGAKTPERLTDTEFIRNEIRDYKQKVIRDLYGISQG